MNRGENEFVKRYCIKCRYLGWYSYPSPPEHYCLHEDNKTKKIVKDDWLERKESFFFISSPKEINKNNDCQWFERKVNE